MSFEIDREILDKTKGCQYNFDCLKTGKCFGCKIKSVATEECIFIDPNKGQEHCHFIFSFGSSYVCRCPTRIELCKKYGQMKS